MSNNPDKIAGMQNAKQIIKEVKSIKHSYLLRKQQSGHLLYEVKTKCAQKYVPPHKIEVFEPFQLKEFLLKQKSSLTDV